MQREAESSELFLGCVGCSSSKEQRSSSKDSDIQLTFPNCLNDSFSSVKNSE